MRRFKLLLFSVLSALLMPIVSISAFAEDGNSTGPITITGDTTVGFVNNKNGIVPTGILMKTWPVILLIVIALVGILIWLFVKKKGSDHQ